MTDTTATTTEPTATDATDTATQAVYIELDPAELVLADNVRDRVDLSTDPEFVASVREHGVLAAITATYDGDGRVVVEDGQRRTLAAREVGLTAVPVLVRPHAGAGKRARFERIARQIVSNDRREALTDGQRAAGIAQMLDLGASVARIAKATQIDKDTVKFAAKAGASTAARDALDAGQLDLEQAAIIGAFEAEGDHDAVTRLLAAPPYQFRHVAQAIANERHEARDRADAATPWAERGHVILDEEPQTWDRDCPWCRLEEVQTPDGAEVGEEHIAAHPQAWAVWLTRDEEALILDRATGEELGEDAVDWNTEDDPDTEPADGLRHVNTVEVRDRWTPDYYTRDLDAADVVLTPVAATVRHPHPHRTATTDRTETVGNDAGGGDGDTDTAVAGTEPSAAEVAQAHRREAEKAERRKVLACNKLGAAAEDVRRRWLREQLLARKTAPKEAAGFVATTLVRHTILLTDHKAEATTLALLGLDTRAGLLDAIAKATPPRAQVLSLAVVVGGLEARTTKDAWRGTPLDGHAVREYLRFLHQQGYALAPIEEVVAGQRRLEQLDWDA